MRYRKARVRNRWAFAVTGASGRCIDQLVNKLFASSARGYQSSFAEGSFKECVAERVRCRERRGCVIAFREWRHTSFAKDYMNPFAFFLALLLIGLTTGWAVGAGLSFTGGRRRIDLIAGLSGAVLAGLPLHVLGPPGYRETLPALLVGLSAAMLATWLTRIRTWKPEPVLRMADDASGHQQLTHDVMTTSDGTRLLLSGGKLGLPDGNEVARRPYPDTAGVGA